MVVVQGLGRLLMARFETFAKDIQLATADLQPEVINRELAKFAKEELAKAIDSKEGSSIYTRYVGGREGAPEESVRVPEAVVYEFSWWQPVIAFALDALRKRSPVLTGRYQNTHVVMIGSQIVSPDVQIASGEEVMIVNVQPYARVLEVGNVKVRAPGDGIYQATRMVVQRQFGKAVDIRFRMVTIPGGYRLKGRFRRGYKQFARTKIRPDTAAGATMTYPALVMNMK
ncbi:MAG: hypothetical protein K2Z25_21150 [Beijerinckiaceae bacterium]|nr:hypothetical protein [Beijerinckiaceae bacterium]